MATKSDFAQKLLTDLRLRKERMAAAQNSSRQSGQTSRVVHGNPGRTSRGARQINAVESAGSRTGNTSRMSNGGSRSINIKESSNQIVLYESGQSSRQVRDLSMAIALPLRIVEISVNWCFQQNSIEVGKQLLKGAIDLEESLRMLVNLQEASKYGNGAQKKSRFFDKPSRNARFVQGATRLKQQALSYPDKNSEQPIGNSEMVLHRRSTSYVQDLSLSTQVKLSSNVSSSQTAQEKGRISNVIAKLMGLEETPQKEDSIRMKMM
ncbi:hypothetical protein Sango_2358800 [Sesamum angolense]|uniref:Uncharacterized protein n=1 Tax=Sesamum angolense TaxID=2727404 RepID=A0AAE1W6A6_9LAMI|nr:hypothetical protein Sango_2358800 [Sesamum angolense]